MTNRNLDQHRAQTTGLGDMIGRCSFDSQHGDPKHPANVGCPFSRYKNNSFFRYTNNEQNDRSHQTPQFRKCTTEDNKLALYCSFRSNPAKSGYRKRLMKIWIEFGRFKAAIRRLTDQVRTKQRMVGYLTLKYFKSTKKYIGNISINPYHVNKYRNSRNS